MINYKPQIDKVSFSCRLLFFRWKIFRGFKPRWNLRGREITKREHDSGLAAAPRFCLRLSEAQEKRLSQKFSVRDSSFGPGTL